MARPEQPDEPEGPAGAAPPEPEHPPNPGPGSSGPTARDLLGFRPSHRAGLSWVRVAAGGRMRRYLERFEAHERDEEGGES